MGILVKVMRPVVKKQGSKIRNDKQARFLLSEAVDKFETGSFSNDPMRYEVMLIDLDVVAEYLRESRPMGRFEWNGKKLSDGLISMAELADWTGWRVQRLTRLFKTKGGSVKHGRFWYTTKRLILDKFPEFMDRVGSRNW